MKRIIEQLKEQRVKAEQTFIKTSFVKRNCKIDAPCPDTDADLDAIAELNLAISILENHGAVKEPIVKGEQYVADYVERTVKT